jgi:hypothetical protein
LYAVSQYVEFGSPIRHDLNTSDNNTDDSEASFLEKNNIELYVLVSE